eukprot:TRINITY_DN5305_c0_g1_i2.p1 TRINITY_DN5305_c0_g1~~TRINITY_DN5305_c0_g1_i2.p1  ORF type:complete len:438 (-),score=92.58 TRINITY_DN5305_c0_g1_i2:56-1369(-)
MNRKIADALPLIRLAKVDGIPNIYNEVLSSVGDASIVMIGEASHGTHDYYYHRAELTKRLITEKGFGCVMVEADWPDAYKVNRYVRGFGTRKEGFSGFKSRFPTWMWRNTVTADFAEWLRAHNSSISEQADKVGFYGMDVYSLYSSTVAVIDYLKKNEPDAVPLCKKRYSCFNRENFDPEHYGLVSAHNTSKSCEEGAIKMLMDMKKYETSSSKEDEAFCARINAEVVKDAEEYYRGMFLRKNTWNIRDQHMANVAEALLNHLRQHKSQNPPKLVLWAHNSHLGDAYYTEFADRGERNVGHYLRQKFGIGKTYNVGFSSYEGTVTGADEWDEPGQVFNLRPAMNGSYEYMFHQIAQQGAPDFSLRFRTNVDRLSPAETRLSKAFQDFELLQRAVGVVYKPSHEMESHMFNAKVSSQFDMLIHIDRTTAVKEVNDSYF